MVILNISSVIGELQLRSEQLAKHYWVAGEQVILILILILIDHHIDDDLDLDDNDNLDDDDDDHADDERMMAIELDEKVQTC